MEQSERLTRLEQEVKDLKELLTERDKHYDRLAQAKSEEVKVALDVMNIRLAGMNEWRATVEALINKTMTSEEVRASLAIVSTKIDGIHLQLLEKYATLKELSDKSAGGSAWGRDKLAWVLGLVSLIAAIIAVARGWGTH